MGIPKIYQTDKLSKVKKQLSRTKLKSNFGEPSSKVILELFLLSGYVATLLRQ